MMEAISTFETPIKFYKTTRRNISENSHLQRETTLQTMHAGRTKYVVGPRVGNCCSRAAGWKLLLQGCGLEGRSVKRR
jgi:hypothetical protein